MSMVEELKIYSNVYLIIDVLISRKFWMYVFNL